MGVRLVKYGVINGTGTYNHDEMDNRDLPDQHPISAITGLEDELNQIRVDIKNTTGIGNIINTKSLTLEYEESSKTLTGNVNIFNSEDNAIKLKATGLFVDKYSDIELEDTSSIHLTMEGKGETLKTMYQSGTVFSHYGGTNNVYNTTEANAWYFDDNLDSFVQPKNTATFTGFVSTIKYRTYTHRATLRSSDSDNDANGLVIAYVTDEDGYPHTLSCIINKGGEGHAGSFYYALVYNRCLTGEQVIKTGTMSNGHSTSGWSNNYITMEVTKAGNAVECSISDWGSTDINLNTVMNIDLTDYTWGTYFTDRVQYGYCNQSQAYSYFTDIYFNGKGPLKAAALLSSEENNCLEIKDSGLYVKNITGNVVTQENHGFEVGDFIYYHYINKYQKALGIDDYDINIVGMVIQIIDENTFIYMTDGFFETDIYSEDMYILGKPLYISDTNPGKITQTQPEISKCVGYPVENGIVIRIERGMQYYQEAVIGDFKTSVTNYKIRSDGYILVEDNAKYDLTLVQELINNVSQDFIDNYLIIDTDNNKVTFKNTDDLYFMNEVSHASINLYIKAF